MLIFDEKNRWHSEAFASEIFTCSSFTKENRYIIVFFFIKCSILFYIFYQNISYIYIYIYIYIR